MAISRRRVLQTLAGTAGLIIAPGRVLGGVGYVAPSDRITIACIGVGSQGPHVMMNFISQPDVQIVAVCDVNRGSDDYVEWGRHELRDKVRTLLGGGSSDWGGNGEYRGPGGTGPGAGSRRGLLRRAETFGGLQRLRGVRGLPGAARGAEGCGSHVARRTFRTCCSQYPGGPRRVHMSVASPSYSGLPRYSSGSASTTSLSRRAQDSLALRPVRLPASPRDACVPAASACAGQVATESNRQLLGWSFHPLVLRALVAHRLLPVFSLLGPCGAGASPPSVPSVRTYERQHSAAPAGRAEAVPYRCWRSVRLQADRTR
jgi:hypothetical protein